MRKTYTFPGGIHPHTIGKGKAATSGAEVVEMPAPKMVAIPLLQHIGAPCQSVVKVGEIVNMGQMIGRPGGFISAPVHASVSGKVKAVEVRTLESGMPGTVVVIENDFEDRLDPSIAPCPNPDALSAEEIVKRIADAGIVGLGGATFPTAVKLAPPKDKPVHTVLLNGTECEPELTCDHRLMLEAPDTILEGLRFAMRAVGAQRGIVAIEDNKPDAIAHMRTFAGGKHDVFELKTKYPQGGEKQLIQATLGKEVPIGKLPMDVGVVVINVATAYAIAKAIVEGMPLFRRIVTVTGAVKSPKNMWVRVGTLLGEVLDAAGGMLPGVDKVILGGPMMGYPVFSLEVGLTKANNGLIAFDKAHTVLPLESNCMRCGKCVEACPVRLMPFMLNAMVNRDRFEEAKKINAESCIECGCCSYICPARRPLAQSIRVAKREIAKRKL